MLKELRGPTEPSSVLKMSFALKRYGGTSDERAISTFADDEVRLGAQIDDEIDDNNGDV